ncbi:hypothetical protein [Apibacter adventoris]|uniref:hypothetical protein n=1 Tax=Apibacter adventoris TaxID=1679466 RepID=UPI000CF72EA4|nr:hypothetical protein [Apibacter adventoris]PQL94517.1 hypothetical protein C4S76_05105 [Apibacter adventoris]
MKKKIIIILILIITIIGSGILYLFQEREYFCLTSNNCITVWKTSEGAYIIPGKYTSWFKPKDNYIKTSNVNAVTIVIDKQSKYDYIISNDYNKSIEVNMSKYKIKYYPYNERNSFEREFYEKNKLKEGLKCLPIDIGEL